MTASLREAAQMALDALAMLGTESWEPWENGHGEEVGKSLDDALAVLTAALALPDEQDKLQQIIARAYQIAGAYDAPEHVLDVLANPLDATQAQIDALLPFSVPDEPVASVLVPVSVLLNWKAAVNETAARSVKTERWQYGVALKQSIADVIAAAPQPAEPKAAPVERQPQDSEIIRLANVALRESKGQPLVTDWQTSAIKVCQHVAKHGIKAAS